MRALSVRFPSRLVEFSSFGQVPMSWTPFVKTGLGIARGKYVSEGRGTAGLIVRTLGESTGAQLMTCAHVLGVRAEGTGDEITNANLVYSPHFRDCCGLECNNPIGSVASNTLYKEPEEIDPATNEAIMQARMEIGGEKFAVDAALVELASDVNAYNRLPELGQIAGVRNLIQEWGLTTPPATLDLPPARQIHVRKHGASSQLTDGVITRLARARVKERVGATIDDVAALVFVIEPSPTQAPFSEEYEIDFIRYAGHGLNVTAAELAATFTTPHVTATVGGSTATPTLKIVGRTFGQPGDSGSPIVDQNLFVVGLLRSAGEKRLFVKGRTDHVLIGTGVSHGIFIDAALQKLKVGFLQPGFHASGAPVLVPGMSVDRPGRLLDWSDGSAALAKIEATPAGARVAALGRQHAAEVRELIHRHRRVAVTWHRYKGAAFAAAVLASARDAARPMPPVIDAVTLQDAIRAMRGVLAAVGSPSLRAALDAHETDLFDLAAQMLADHATDAPVSLAD